MAKGDKLVKGFALPFVDVELSPLVRDLATAVSLFSEKNIYFVKCDKDANLEFMTAELLEVCKNSEHGFIFWGKSLDFKKTVEVAGFTLEEKKEPLTNPFPKELVEAIQSLDKKNAWLLLNNELENKSAEEVYGLCNWALKQMLVVGSMPSFDPKSGVKDFQYRQTKRAVDKIDEERLQKIYFELVNTYNTSRTQSVGLDTALEMWVLGW